MQTWSVGSVWYPFVLSFFFLIPFLYRHQHVGIRKKIDFQLESLGSCLNLAFVSFLVRVACSWFYGLKCRHFGFALNTGDRSQAWWKTFIRIHSSFFVLVVMLRVCTVVLGTCTESSLRNSLVLVPSLLSVIISNSGEHRTLKSWVASTFSATHYVLRTLDWTGSSIKKCVICFVTSFTQTPLMWSTA